MKSRIEYKIPGPEELSPSIWNVSEEGLKSIGWLLEEAGFDFSAPSIDIAIANLHELPDPKDNLND